jgi:hypothetical protein
MGGPGRRHSPIFASLTAGRAPLVIDVPHENRSLAAHPTTNLEQRTTNVMDKRDKKRSEVLKQKITKSQQLLAAAKQQMDDPDEVRSLEKQIAEAQAELAKLKD